MVKLSEAKSYDHVNKKVTGKLFADAKSEIGPSMVVVGLPEGYTMDFGSSVMTADAEIAYMKSDGTWNWN